ncbi:MAG: hypothetical protein AAGG75_06080 [Bacteroidota bacterium]
MSTTQFNFEFLGFKGEIFFDTQNKPSEDGRFQLLKPTSGSAGNGIIENITWNGNTLTGKLSGSMAYMVGNTPTYVNGFEGTCVLTFNDDLTSFTGKYSDAPTQAAFQKIPFVKLIEGHSFTFHPSYYPYYLSGATAATSSVELPGKTTAAPHKRVTLMRFVYGSSVNSGWCNAIPTKETKDFQLIEFYYDQTAHTIYLYKLNQEFIELPSEEEQYKILAGGTLKSGYKPLLRAFSVKDLIGPDYLNPLPDQVAFDQILPLVFFEIFQRFPSDIYGVRYSGHGGPNSMFGMYAFGYHQCRILRAINTMLGRKIDFLDWNSNCNMGSLHNMLNQYQYTDYIVAADLERTNLSTYGFGSTNDPLKRSYSKRKYTIDPRVKYPDYFAGGADVPTALKASMDYLFPMA